MSSSLLLLPVCSCVRERPRLSQVIQSKSIASRGSVYQRMTEKSKTQLVSLFQRTRVASNTVRVSVRSFLPLYNFQDFECNCRLQHSRSSQRSRSSGVHSPTRSMQPHVRRSAREVSQTQVYQAGNVPSGHRRVAAALRGSRLNRDASHALTATLARLSEAEAKCAKELREQTAAPSDRPAWASERIATAAVPLCHDPMAAADAAGTLANLTVDDEGSNAVVEAGAIVPLV